MPQAAKAKTTVPAVDSTEAQEMSDKAYVIRFKHPQLSTQPAVAASAEIHAEHIALLDSKCKLAALFLTEAAESCSESPYRSQYGETERSTHGAEGDQVLPSARVAAAALSSFGTEPFSPPGYGCLYCAVPATREVTGTVTTSVRSWRCSRCSEPLAEWHDRPP
jgi:hypothetical protein